MDPLTPNTTALLEYIASNYNNNNGTNDLFNNPAVPQQPMSLPFSTNSKGMPNSLPPSAFNMPVPGRDTPEATPESSNGADASPDDRAKRGKSGSADIDAGSDSDALVAVDDPKSRRKSMNGTSGAGAQNKRKAGHTHKVEQVSDEEEGMFSPNCASPRRWLMM